MYKLIILFSSPDKMGAFEQDWQKFLSLAEKMPGLRREAVSRVERTVFALAGEPIYKIHELLFDSKDALEAAINSPAGQAAGQWLQEFTRGRVMILTAEHLEAVKEDFRKK